MKQSVTFLAISLFGLWGCKDQKQPDIPVEPQIYNLSMNPNKMNVADPNALIKIQFEFRDGDQDIANDPNGTDSSIFIKDSRDTGLLDYTFVYPMPYIPNNLRPEGALEGFVTINLNNAYFSARDSLHFALGKDTLYWSIYLRDQSGHRSNTVETDPIYLTY